MEYLPVSMEGGRPPGGGALHRATGFTPGRNSTVASKVHGRVLRGLDHIFVERFRSVARYRSAVEALFSSFAFLIFQCALICNGAMAFL